jgi:hypothetical protein
MKSSVLFSLLAPAGAVTALANDKDMSLKTRPIMKVVRMLEDMKAELNKELEDDKAVHEMMDCWCSTNEKEKTKAIELGTSRINELEALLGETIAKIKELKSKRKSIQEEQYKDQAALDEAEELRMKENKEFHGAETDLLEAIDATKNAIIVLSKHHPELAQIKAVVRMLQAAKIPQLMLKSGSFNNLKAQELKDFLTGASSATETSFLQRSPGLAGQSYQPQSGQIFGILKQMKEDFDTDLGQEQKAEAKAVEEFKALKESKLAEIDTAKKAIVQFDQDLARLGQTNAESLKELEDVEEQLGMDQEFLKNLQEKCANTDEEFEKRVKSRLEEIEAVEDTIEILNDDKAFAAFDKTSNSFLQVSSQQQEKARRAQAAAVLQKAARDTNQPKLALIAISAQLDVFTKVKEEIDKMVAELQTQQKDEIDHRDNCIESLNTNKRDQTAAYDKKSSLETKIADLDQSIKTLGDNIEASTQAIAEAQTQMKRRSETREGENADYQTTVQDQRLTQMILQKAIDRMSQVYALMQMHQPGAPHIQTSGTHTDPGNGPAKFKGNSAKSSGGKRVIAMLDDVMKDSKTMEDEAIAAEESAQNAYENFMKDSNKMIISTTKMINDMTEAKAKAKADLIMAKTDFKQTMSELEGLNNEAGDLHKSCDYLLKNFDLRQQARAAEIDALNEAKNILSGMK